MIPPSPKGSPEAACSEPTAPIAALAAFCRHPLRAQSRADLTTSTSAFLAPPVLKGCDMSATFCRNFGFGDSAKGPFLFFVFVGLAMLLLQFVVAENARRHREQLERMVRRLWYAKSGKLVAAPRIKTGGYHVFLSHVVS
eukprot:1184992-Prymnesium_polylepis.1